jgi:hypothetical protein
MKNDLCYIDWDTTEIFETPGDMSSEEIWGSHNESYRLAMARTILSYNANINAYCDIDVKQPPLYTGSSHRYHIWPCLYEAAHSQQRHLVRLLLKSGASIDMVPNSFRGNDCMRLACSFDSALVIHASSISTFLLTHPRLCCTCICHYPIGGVITTPIQIW